MFFLLISFFFELGLTYKALQAQETKKYRVPRIVVDKIKEEFPGLQVKNLSVLKDLDQYIIEGEIFNESRNQRVNVSVSITGESGLVIQASIRLTGLEFQKEEDRKFIFESTPKVPWNKFLSKLDKKESIAGIAFLSFSDLTGEREYTLNTNHKREIKPSIIFFDEYGNLIRREKMKY